MATLCAFGQRRNHRGARGHVDARRQRFCGKHHLHQTLLEQLLNQLLPGREDSCMVRSNATQQGISVNAIANSFRIG